jgi:hypothetical protein
LLRSLGHIQLVCPIRLTEKLCSAKDILKIEAFQIIIDHMQKSLKREPSNGAGNHKTN